MLLDDLLSRRLVVLTGKGGVGKSVVGASLALAARARGKRVLLVEVGAPLEAARLLGGPPSKGRVKEALPGLSTVNLDPATVMDEYVRHVVPVDLLARRVLSSPIYRRFFSAAPGLRELMILGKIMVLEEARARLSRRPAWDVIVVDAPATGHGLAFLKVPLVASRAIPVGPVGHNARRVLKLLRDPGRTGLVVVAVPEEMAVVEALEFQRLAADELEVEPAAAVLNACHERRFSDPEEAEVLRLTAEEARGSLEPGVALPAALRAARRQIRRRRLTRLYRGRLKRGLAAPLASLPFLFRETLEREDLELLAERLEAA
ncbi:MAG: chromosome partitioning protein [Acidobacteria bacterium]|nr:chromosome partitioning protein [Acidobacteriota bacterium]